MNVGEIGIFVGSHSLRKSVEKKPDIETVRELG